MRTTPDSSAVRSSRNLATVPGEDRRRSAPAAVATELASDTRQLTTKARPARRRSVRLPNVLSIGMPEGQPLEGVSHMPVRQPREIIEMLRVLHFNLLLVGPNALEPATWAVLELVHRYWPQLRWVLMPGENTGDREEIMARSLGATSVGTDLRVIVELAGGKPVAV